MKKEEDFHPNIKTSTRILHCLEDQGPIAKTKLSRKTNLNYTRLANHVGWMEKKGYVESVIRESKINIKLTAEGRLFSKSISNEE